MSIISDFFSTSLGTVVSEVGKAVDSLVTSDEERLKLKNELIIIELQAKLKSEELDLQFEQEVTKRQASDNEHIITRLMRPVGLAWVLVLFTVVMIGDGNFGISIKPAYIPILETVLITYIVSLLGSRGIEKVTKTIKGV
jgi:hypothetical protein